MTSCYTVKFRRFALSTSRPINDAIAREQQAKQSKTRYARIHEWHSRLFPGRKQAARNLAIRCPNG
jgi:uncharacterized protein YdeI (YjbR/CyaY-like superfamily)